MKKDFVVVGFVVYGSKTLLLKHKKLNMWLPPGGHIEEGETPEEAVLREVLEETGLKVEIVADRDKNLESKTVKSLLVPRFIQLEDIDGKHQHIDMIYFCKTRNEGIRLKEDESDDIMWFSKSELDGSEITRNVAYIGKLAIDEVNRG